MIADVVKIAIVLVYVELCGISETLCIYGVKLDKFRTLQPALPDEVLQKI